MKTFWKNKGLAMVLLVVAIGFFAYAVFVFRVNQATADSSDNVSGWVWSENIGWISLNCTNESGPACAGTNGYGVDIDFNTGVLSGMAWSENIGFISFDAVPDLNGCPGSICQAWVDMPNCVIAGITRKCPVMGWARARSAKDDPVGSGGWDGWISLNCLNSGVCLTSNYEVYYYDDGAGSQVLGGWAWGGGTSDKAVIGWISFSDRAFDSDDDDFVDPSPPAPPGGPVGPPFPPPVGDYEPIAPVINSPVGPNNPPNPPDNLVVTYSPCTATSQAVLRYGIVLNWDYSDLDGDAQTEFEVEVDNGPICPRCEDTVSNVFRHRANAVIPDGGTGSYALDRNDDDDGDWLYLADGLAWNRTFAWRVRVKDGTGSNTWSDWSDWSDQNVGFESISTPLHAPPKPDFDWKLSSSAIMPSVGELVQMCSVDDGVVVDCVGLADESVCYNSAHNFSNSGGMDCDDTVQVFLWELGPNGETDPNGEEDTQNPKIKFNAVSTGAGYEVKLNITDVNTCQVMKRLKVTVPLPNYREVAPN